MSVKSDQLLPLSALAKRWGWSVSKLHRLVARKGIPHLRLGKRRDVFFRESAIEAWLAEQTVPAKDSSPAASQREDGYDDEELRRFGLTREDCAFLER